MEKPVKIGISACLLGEKVRYDGGHKLDHLLAGSLGPYLDFVPVCPEAECGLGIPREPMRLMGNPDAPRLITVRTNIDHTEKIRTWAKKRVQVLEQENLCGFIFKSRSPSCGMRRIKVYGAAGMPPKKGVGLFARAFMDHFPLLPAEEEERHRDRKARENFIDQIFTLKRWRHLLESKKSRQGLVAFHARHQLLIMAHSEKQYRRMGKLVAQAKPLNRLFTEYENALLAALRLKTTVKKNRNVLLHALGSLKKVLTANEKQELVEIVGQYQQELLPLLAPITRINHYVRKYKQDSLAGQFYLNPHPLELRLRNHG